MSDKNLLCIVLTFGLAFFTIGNSFRTGNYVLGFETVFIWSIVYSIMPLIKIIDKKTECESAPIDIKAVLYRTVQNNYLFISFCIALLLSILFDDYVDFTGHFVEDNEGLDAVIIPLLVGFSTVFSLVFYMFVSKRRIEKLKTYGTKVDAEIETIKTINNVHYIKASAINPLTGEKTTIVGTSYADTKEEIPDSLPVYFDEKNPLEFYFDSYVIPSEV